MVTDNIYYHIYMSRTYYTYFEVYIYISIDLPVSDKPTMAIDRYLAQSIVAGNGHR